MQGLCGRGGSADAGTKGQDGDVYSCKLLIMLLSNNFFLFQYTVSSAD